MSQVNIPKKEIAKWFFSFGIYQPKIEIDLTLVEELKEKEKPEVWTGEQVSLPRGRGKTTTLLNIAYNNPNKKYLIISTNNQRALFVKRMIADFGLQNIASVSIDEYRRQTIANPMMRNREMLVDDIEDVFAEIIGRPVTVFSTSRKNVSQ